MPSPSLQIQIHTYHCLCTTHLLTTPYTLSSLPHRAPPALDNATILPLPPLSSPSSPPPNNNNNNNNNNDNTPNTSNPNPTPTTQDNFLPSLLSPSMRLARKAVVVRRDDGFEKRRVWRCGRCGLGIGYEVVGAAGGEEEGGRERVVYLLEGGLMETGEMMEGGGGDDVG